jgi:hypothetical protein
MARGTSMRFKVPTAMNKSVLVFEAAIPCERVGSYPHVPATLQHKDQQ